MSDRRFIAAFITGHSVRGCTGLSQKQQSFQQRSGLSAEHWLPHNFPYKPTFAFPERFPLLRASVNNARHYFASRRPSFARQHGAAVNAVLQPYDTILLLAGSCGLELFNNLRLADGLRSRIHIFACGPVSRRRPEVASCVMVQGTGDWLSRLCHRTVDHRYECSHMGYLDHPETLRLFQEYHHHVTAA